MGAGDAACIFVSNEWGDLSHGGNGNRAGIGERAGSGDQVVELSARKEESEHSEGADRNRAAREALEEWQRTKPDAASQEPAGT